MMTTALFVTPGRSNFKWMFWDFQATAHYDKGQPLSSYSGMTREDCIEWLEHNYWGSLGYRPAEDSRYSIAREYFGHPEGAQYVVRYCGNWLSLYAKTRIDAEALRDDYAVQRRWDQLLPQLHTTGEPL